MHINTKFLNGYRINKCKQITCKRFEQKKKKKSDNLDTFFGPIFLRHKIIVSQFFSELNDMMVHVQHLSSAYGARE